MNTDENSAQQRVNEATFMACACGALLACCVFIDWPGAQENDVALAMALAFSGMLLGASVAVINR